jgi:hypothetical protein
MREPSTLETRQEKQATKQKGHAPELFRVVTATELADAIESGDVPGETKLLVLVAGQNHAIGSRAEIKDVLNEKDLVGLFKCYRPVFHGADGTHSLPRSKKETVLWS